MNPKLIPISILCSRLCKFASAAVLVYTLTVGAGTSAQAQTFTVVHSFAGGPDGDEPVAGLISDARGNLFGTTSASTFGQNGPGNVYMLTKGQSGWPLTSLAVFGQNMTDGYQPQSRLTIGPDGAFYGTTVYGGGDASCGGGGCGTIFRLNSAAGASHSVIHRFSVSRGSRPVSEVTFDRDGNMFGTTVQGGSGGGGTVYELTRNGNGWTGSVIYNFDNLLDGTQPAAGLILDSAGNLFGTTVTGGDKLCQCGVVFELSPSAMGWTYRVLHRFIKDTDGWWPTAGLILDAAGNLYGTTSWGGSGGGAGTVFELSPSGNNWNFSTIYTLPYMGGYLGNGPGGGVIMDADGNLYGTTAFGGAYSQGSVFKLTPTNRGWELTSLHDFQSSPDGKTPYGDLLMDARGAIFGTTRLGGDSGHGTVWEITR